MSGPPGDNRRRPLGKDGATVEVSTNDNHSVPEGTAGGALSGHPEPQVPRRPAVPAEVPTMAGRLAKSAASAGWTVVLTYARGTAIDRRGRSGIVVHSLAARLSKGTDRAVAIWIDDAFESGWTWTTEPVTVPRAVAYRPLLTQVLTGAVLDA